MVAVESSSVIGDVSRWLVGVAGLGGSVRCCNPLVVPAVANYWHRSSRLLLFEMLERLERLYLLEQQ